MTEEFSPRDPVLEDALRTLSNPLPRTHEIEPLRRAIRARAAPELSRRRARERRRWLIAPIALAASIALLMYSVPLPNAADRGQTPPRAGAVPGGAQSLEGLLDAEVSDRQFRALLFGATEADELLLIAAGDNRRSPDETR